MTSLSTFETLPDEIILQVCSYLYGADVLYSLYNLNTRLNITILGYCRYVDLRGVIYYRFDQIVSHILPQIASFVRSCVFHGYREKLLSAKAFAVFFASPISFTFPQLQRITLDWFTGERLSSIIDILQNLPQLVELNIRSLMGAVEETLLVKALAANNGRLQSVTFDQESLFLNVPETNQTTSYLNIEKLALNVTQCRMLPHLFALIPCVRRLYVRIEEWSYNSSLKEAFNKLSPLIHLIDFQLYLIDFFCNLDEITDVLRQMPSLQTLTLGLRTEDEHLIKPENFVKILPPSLKHICFFIRYYYDEPVVEVNSLIASWSAVFPINCLLDTANERVLMFTDSLGLRLLNLPAAIGKQMLHGCKYTQRVKNLYVFGSTSLTDILLTVQHFHCLRRLRINVKENTETCALTSSKQSTMLNLPQLKHLDISGICGLLDVLKAAPNLDDLLLDYDCLTILIDDKSTWDLLQQRIVRLDVRSWTDIEPDLLQRVSHEFRHLRYLCLSLKDSMVSSESILSTILAHSNIDQLAMLIVGIKVSDEINKNLRQWVIDHTHLTVDDSFAVSYINNFFILWK